MARAGTSLFTYVLCAALFVPDHADGVRIGSSIHEDKIDAGTAGLKCIIAGPGNESVAFPVKKCDSECVKATTWKGTSSANMQTVMRFSTAFAAELHGDKCQCSVNGNTMVQYRALGKKQKDDCMENSDDAKMLCWEVYKIGRSTEIMWTDTADGTKLVTAKRHPEWYREAKFVIDKTCTPCETDDECNEIIMPSLISGLGDDARKALMDTICKGSGDGKVDRILKEFGKLLPDEDMKLLQDEAMAKDENAAVDIQECLGAATTEPPVPEVAGDEEEMPIPGLNLVGISEDEKNEIKDMMEGGALMLNPAGIDDSLCELLLIGAQSCEVAARGQGGDKMCRCQFVGAKPKTCEDIFGTDSNSAYPVKRNGRIALFGAEGCECRGDKTTWPKSECDLPVRDRSAMTTGP